MQGILAPSGFFPVPEQKTHFFKGFSSSIFPVPLQTTQLERGESKLKGSCPFPLQNAHLMMFDITNEEFGGVPGGDQNKEKQFGCFNLD